MKQFRTVHIDYVKKIAKNHEQYCWHEDDPSTRRITGLAVLGKGLPELEGVSGVHVTVVNPNLKQGNDYAFDFRDINDNEILPFFTAEKPLFLMLVHYNDLYKAFPELKRVSSAKVGLCDNDTMRAICGQCGRTGIEQKFDTCRVDYSSGFIWKK
jgi:hypothetical protein